MKINIEPVIKLPEVAPGDVLVSEKGSYLVIFSDHGDGFPYKVANLKTFETVNGFRTLKNLPSIGGLVCSTSGKVIEIIKSSELELKRV